MKAETLITSDPIGVDAVSDVASPADGALVVFYGIVRGETEGRSVSVLEYEAYTAMAEQKMHEIAAEALEKWNVDRIRIVHRVGALGVGEISVAVAVAAAHRGPAFDACEFCIDTLKQTVPIWKKELFEDGTHTWVNHP